MTCAVATVWQAGKISFFVWSIMQDFTLAKFNYLNTMHRSVRRWKLSEQFYCKGLFFLSNLNVLRFQAAITPQWLQIARNSLPIYPSMGCVVSIFTIGINSKSFPWAICSTEELYSQIFTIHRLRVSTATMVYRYIRNYMEGYYFIYNSREQLRKKLGNW